MIFHFRGAGVADFGEGGVFRVGYPEFAEAWRLFEFPSKGVFPAAAADEEDITFAGTGERAFGNSSA